jgi:hypothetical protein
MENGAASIPPMSQPSVPTNPNQVPESAWIQVVQALKRHKGRRFVIGPLLRGCRTPYLDNDVMVLPFMHRTIMENLQSEMEDPLTRDAMSKAVAQSFGRSYELRITLLGADSGDGRPASATSHLVRAARALGGKIIEERKVGNDEQAIS